MKMSRLNASSITPAWHSFNNAAATSASDREVGRAEAERGGEGGTGRAAEEDEEEEVDESEGERTRIGVTAALEGLAILCFVRALLVDDVDWSIMIEGVD